MRFWDAAYLERIRLNMIDQPKVTEVVPRIQLTLLTPTCVPSTVTAAHSRSCRCRLWNVSPHCTPRSHQCTHTPRLHPAHCHSTGLLSLLAPPREATAITWSPRSRWHASRLRTGQSWDLPFSSSAAYFIEPEYPYLSEGSSKRPCLIGSFKRNGAH